ncbi:MAG: ABC transporter permease [Candidatus Tectomicrobia bacterium]|uniref:ABC transporter permease n=1 Tax=Tectimicrobiota bacterium TaxID=2528274 RepID=A0A932M0W3_UNCTE|nr:ABC transporter permease [Candidatus Tectomicrobia bacterium]
MLPLVLRRLVSAIPTLFIVATLSFVLMRLVPGGPFDREKKLPPAIQANVERKYHLDEPVWKQYLLYMGSLARGDFGPSYKYLGRSVNDILREAFPVSLQLGLFSLVLSVLCGVGTGIVSAWRPGSWLDRGGGLFSVLGFSLPTFVLGSLLVFSLADSLHFFPPALWEGWRFTVLPVVTLSFAPAAFLARLCRASLLEVMEKDFVRTARAKGLRESRVILRHALKNALTPVVSVVGPLTAGLVTGSFVVETIFSLPGMGKHFVTAVTNRDYPLIMGVTLMYTVLIILANMIVDLLYGILDPRVRVE